MFNDNEVLLFNNFSANIKTKDSYKALLEEFKGYIEKDLLTVVPEDVEGFLKSRKKNNNNTKRRKYHQLLSFYNYLLENYKIESNPVRSVSPPKASKQINIERTLEFDELHKLLNVLKEHFSLRDYLFTLLIATTGMKLGEVRKLMWSDFFIDDNDNIGVLIGPKDNKRYIKIFNFVWETIDEYRRDYLKVNESYLSEDYYLFFPQNKLNLYRIYPKMVKPISRDWITKTYSKACDMAGIPFVTSKDIRHCYTMLSIKLGVDLHGIKDQLGWSNTSFINRYHGIVEILSSPLNKLIEDYYTDLFKKNS